MAHEQDNEFENCGIFILSCGNVPGSASGLAVSSGNTFYSPLIFWFSAILLINLLLR